MRPFGADLERFAARRLMRGALAAALLLTVVVFGVQTVRGHQYVKRYENQMFSEGSFDPATGELRPSATPTIEVYKEPHDSRINVARTLSNTLTTSGILLVIVSFVLGASFVGAEFGGSGLSTQLLYEPRRWRVHVSKAAAVAVSCAAFALCVLCTIALATFVGGKLHGVAQGIDRDFWFGRGHDIARGVVAAGCAGAMAYAVALAFRRSAVAIVVFLAQIPIVGYVDQSRTLIGMIGRSLPYYGLHMFVLGRAHLPSDPKYLLGVTTSAAALAMTAAWVIGFFGGGGLLFARSEVR